MKYALLLIALLMVGCGKEPVKVIEVIPETSVVITYKVKIRYPNGELRWESVPSKYTTYDEGGLFHPGDTLYFSQ